MTAAHTFVASSEVRDRLIKHGTHDQKSHGNWATGGSAQEAREWATKNLDVVWWKGDLNQVADKRINRRPASPEFRHEVAQRVERVRAEERVQSMTTMTGVELPQVVASDFMDSEREFDPYTSAAPVAATHFQGALIVLHEDMIKATQGPPFEPWSPDADEPHKEGVQTLVSGGLDAVIRHEYGHSLWHAKVLQHPDWEEYYDQGVGVQGKGIFSEWTEARRDYTGARLDDDGPFRGAMNGYAANNIREAFAEQVAYILDPQFTPDNFTPEGMKLLQITAQLVGADPKELGL